MGDRDAGTAVGVGAGLGQQGREHGALGCLAVHSNLGERHPGAVVQARQQVRRRAVAGTS